MRYGVIYERSNIIEDDMIFYSREEAIKFMTKLDARPWYRKIGKAKHKRYRIVELEPKFEIKQVGWKFNEKQNRYAILNL